MDEIKIALLGFDSYNVTRFANDSASTTANSSSDNNNIVNENNTYRIHPLEKEAIMSTQRLSDMYKELAKFAHRVDMGRVYGVYSTALGCAIDTLLNMYKEDVVKIALPSQLFTLSNSYELSFTLLTKMTKLLPLYVEADKAKSTSLESSPEQQTEHHKQQQQMEEEKENQLSETHALQFFTLLNKYTTHQEIAVAHRIIVGGNVWRSMLYHIAHFVTHGAVLDSGFEFFIKASKVKINNRTTTADQHANLHHNSHHAASDMFSLELALLPCNMNNALAEHIYNAGCERWAVLACNKTIKASSSSFTEFTPSPSSFSVVKFVFADNNIMHNIRTPSTSPEQAASLKTNVEKEKDDKITKEDKMHCTETNENNNEKKSICFNNDDERCATLTVFNAIYNNSLIDSGVLNVLELETRILTVRQLWSQWLWEKIGSVNVVVAEMRCMHEMLLNCRGDIWHAVTEHLFMPLINAFTSLQPKSSSMTTSSLYTLAQGLADRNESNARSTVDNLCKRRVQLIERVVNEALRRAVELCDGFDSCTYRAFTLHYQSSNDTNNNNSVINNNMDNNNAIENDASRQTIEGIAGSVLDVLHQITIHVDFTYALQLIVSTNAQEFYRKLFYVMFAIRFALYALHQAQRIFVQGIVTNKKPSRDLRRAYALFQKMHFLLNSFNSYVQIDIVHSNLEKWSQRMKQCSTIHEATSIHNELVWSLANGAFILSEHAEIYSALECLLRCAITLYVACTRYRLNYWAVANVNETPIEVLAVLRALETRLRHRVVEVLFNRFGYGVHNEWERALWIRIDFNRFISEEIGNTSSTTIHGRESYSYETTPNFMSSHHENINDNKRLNSLNDNHNNNKRNEFHVPTNTTAAEQKSYFENNNHVPRNTTKQIRAVPTLTSSSLPHVTSTPLSLVSSEEIQSIISPSMKEDAVRATSVHSPQIGVNVGPTHSTRFQRTSRQHLLSPSPLSISTSPSTSTANTANTPSFINSNINLTTPRHGKVVKRSASQGVSTRKSELMPASELVSAIVANVNTTTPINSSSQSLLHSQLPPRRMSALHPTKHMPSLPPKRTHSSVSLKSHDKMPRERKEQHEENQQK